MGVQVVYSADGWLYKNRDPVNDNVVSLLKESTFPFMQTLWATTTEVSCWGQHAGFCRRMRVCGWSPCVCV